MPVAALGDVMGKVRNDEQADPRHGEGEIVRIATGLL